MSQSSSAVAQDGSCGRKTNMASGCHHSQKNPLFLEKNPLYLINRLFLTDKVGLSEEPTFSTDKVGFSQIKWVFFR